LTLAAVIDNDVLQKFSSYGLVLELEETVRRNGVLGILGAARFIVRRALNRLTGANDSELHTAFEEFLHHAIALEPTDEEITLATEMEEVANRESLGFDSGESQLCAIAITRGIDAVVTGDKRAIEAGESIKNSVPSLAGLVGKIVCLEQMMLGVMEAFGYSKTRSHVCAVKEVDTALSICLKCWSPEAVSQESVRSSFESYINDLRNKAPSLLRAGYVFPSS
jgi:hypothetical protein